MKWIIVKDTKVKTQTIYCNHPYSLGVDREPTEYDKARSTIYETYEDALKGAAMAEKTLPVPFIVCPCDPTLSHDTGIKEYLCLL